MEYADIEYASTPTYGNVAYDLSRVRGYGAPEEAAFDLPREDTERRVNEKTETGTVALPRISFLAVMGFALAAVMLVFVLLSYVSLTAISTETAALERQLAAVTQENEQLKIKYENTFNMRDIEDYAKNVLGMSKLSKDQITVLNISRADKAEVLESNDSDTGNVVSDFADYLTSLMEYFK